MKKIFTSLLVSLLTILITPVFAQEALKSVEEEYYDFLSLTGVVERPTLGYRTLSDSVWTFNEVENFEENEDGTFTKVRTPGEESSGHIWKNNNLGTTYTLWQPEQQANNWFARGLKQGITARVYGPEWFNSFNHNLPYGFNDGALWQGRGYNTSLTTGIRLEAYGFEITLKPQLSWSQNLPFDINNSVYPSDYSYSFKNRSVYHIIDVVQRYGESSLWNFNLGDTEVRWTWHTLTFGFGTQNPWLGPAYLNPMLGSNNAPGYLKFDAGLRKTDVKLPFTELSLGSIEGRIWIGKLKESEYFKNLDTNNTFIHNDRMLTAMSASYEPSFIPGFTIGLNRVFITYWRPENLKYVLRLFTASRSNALSSSGNDEDQKFSLFADWTFSKIGFEVYGEFGRDDFSSDERANPFHTAIYTVGAKQKIPLNFQKLNSKLPSFFNFESELNFEWNNFEMSQDFQLQWPYMGYYAHGFIHQGYTHKGQIIGAGTGWAGNSQYIQYKIFYPYGFLAFHFHRHVPNLNSIYSMAVNESANNSVSELNLQWYGHNETYFDLGVNINFYLFKNLNIDLAYSYISLQNSYSGYGKNYFFNCNLKYLF